MNSNLLGNLGLAKVLCKCLLLGFRVFLPYGDGSRVDLILLKNNKLYKVQIKASDQDENGAIPFYLISGRKTNNSDTANYYMEDEIDFYLLYSMKRNKVYLVPFSEAPKKEIKIRYLKSSINLPSIRYEDEYLFEEQIKKIFL